MTPSAVRRQAEHRQRFGTLTASKIEVGANYALGFGVKMMGGLISNDLQGPSKGVAQHTIANREREGNSVRSRLGS